MALGPKVLTGAAFLLAACLSWLSAGLAAGLIEERSGAAVEEALRDAGHSWAEVDTDGLLVHLGGTAPTEAARFSALSVGGQVVEAARLIDGMTVRPTDPLAPPRFSIEILRNDDGVSLIGLVPAALDRETMAAEIASLTDGAEVTDLLQSADHPVPDGWVQSLDFGLDALARLPRSKISISAGGVAITALSGSRAEQLRLEEMLRRLVPETVSLTLSVRSPRPVITPFTLRFIAGSDRARFDACAVDSVEGRDRIIAAAKAAGLQGPTDCTLGLGVPTPDWTDAVVQGLSAVAELDGGSLTFSDADVTLVALEGTDQALFDRVVGALESNLPDVFSLEAVLPEAPAGTEQDAAPPPEFLAVRGEDGAVELRGRLPSTLVHRTVESFARARFGMEKVYMAARVAEGLPEGWPVRVLAGLAALAELDHGQVVVHESDMSVQGVSGNPDARDEIARLLTTRLGGTPQFALEVAYDERLDPLADLPTPQECVRRIDLILESRKITFAPGSTDVEGEAGDVVDQIAEVLRGCRKVEMELEVAGHTDSQGREQMNLELSQARAEAVLEALLERRVPPTGLTAAGYGESEPIADNDTEAGREANRRIEFRLISPAPNLPSADRTGAGGSTGGGESEDGRERVADGGEAAETEDGE